MGKNDSSEKKEAGLSLGQPMPSRRATRHVEKIQILKETPKAETPEPKQEKDKKEPVQIKDYVKKLSLPKITWKKPDKKMILKIVLGVIALLIVAAVVTGIVVLSQKEDHDGYSRNFMDQLRMQEIRLVENEPANAFFRQYYDAMSAGDTTILEGMYDNPAKADVSAGVSTIVESYDNLAVYMTGGLEENEFVAFVYNDVKFNNINTLAPSVDCFYLVMGDDGVYKICWDMNQNVDKIRFCRRASYMMPIRQLLSDSDAALQSALSRDKDLKNLYIVMQSMTDAVLEQDASVNGN